MEQISLQINRKKQYILIKNILKIEAIHNYSLIYLNNNVIVKSARTLKSYELKLSHFIRCNRQVLINPFYIKKQEIHQITLENEERILLSRRKKKRLRDLQQTSFNKNNL